MSSSVATAAIDDLEVVTMRTRAAPHKDFGNTIDLDAARLVALAPPARIYRPSSAPPPPAGVLEQPLRLFRGHYHRVVALGMGEALLVAASLYAALVLRFGTWAPAELQASVGTIWPRALAIVAIVTLSMASMGLYQLRQRSSFAGVVARIIAALAVSELAMMCLFYAIPGLFVGRGVMFMTAAVAGLSFLASRFAFMRLVDDDVFKTRVLVWGCGERAASIATRLRRRCDQRGFRIVGYIQPPGEACRVDVAVRIDSREELAHFLAQHRVEQVVIAMDDRRRGFPTELLRDCRMRGVPVRDVVSFLEDENGYVNVDLAKPSWLIFSDGFRTDFLRTVGKRAFDICVALALIIVTLPVTLATALLIWLEDRGPIFYRQVRTGQFGQPFEILKFRSMGVNAERHGAVWAQRDDPRVTRVGAFIRRVRIDEIPQAINVLLGQLSFVGPRPERPAFVEQLSRRIPFYAERHFAKPGITGWAQVRFPYGSTEADAREKLGFDLYYVKKQSVIFDLLVLLRTVEIVVFRVGAR